MKWKCLIAGLLSMLTLSAICTSCGGGSHLEDTTDTADPPIEAIYITVQNPVFPSGADPWVVRHDDLYYYCYSTGNGVAVAKINSPAEISPVNGQVVYTAPEGTMYSADYWAPELHYINGEWYIYVAADDGNNENHRMYVLRGTTQNPADSFEMVGQITDSTNKWAIDGTVLQHNDSLYFIWSGWEGDSNVQQNLYIAHMSDPCTIDSERVRISRPELFWEKRGSPLVNEGPCALKHKDKTYIVYSASGSWTNDYCLGLLTLTGDDPLDPKAWTKTEESVFKRRNLVAYGPGHCSFTTAVDGSVWMIYHANLVSGTGWGGRSVWIAPITFDEQGVPVFGIIEKKVQYPAHIK